MMTNRLLAVSALILSSFVAQPLLAQTAASSPSRADVKAEIPADRTKDAQISGERMPPKKQWTPPASGDNQPKTRAQVKKETTDAIAADKAPVTKGDTVAPASETKAKPPRKTFKQRRAEAAAAREARRPEATEAAKNQDPTGGVYDPNKKPAAKP
ncbi:hypothetical protein ASC87_25705 [Rhizobacter sp. Root1221]|nr:hypothetical protein ASC87_25705 [Rhizobacter sp. Root1221]